MDTVDFDEPAALAAAQRGDRAAFGALVRQYQRRAYAAAYRLVGNREDALELAQDSFVKAYRAIGRFDPQLPFYPWLYRIVKNTCLNHLKRRGRRGEQSLDALMEQGYDARTPEPSPCAAAQQGDFASAIRMAMSKLAPEHREILYLRHFRELSYAEIAAVLDVPQGTVMSRLHAARKRLRGVLEEQEPAPARPGVPGAQS